MSLELDFPGSKERNQSKTIIYFHYIKRRKTIGYLLLFPPELFCIPVQTCSTSPKGSWIVGCAVFQVILFMDTPEGDQQHGRVRSQHLFSRHFPHFLDVSLGQKEQLPADTLSHGIAYICSYS